MLPYDIQPTDIAIFLVSFAACVYCIVLSRRLKALQDTRDGLGATIMALTKSVSAMSSATHETRSQANELASRLATLMKDADMMCARLTEMTETLETAHAKTHKSAQAAQSELRVTLGEMLHESRERSADMQGLLKRMRALSAAASAPRGGDFLFDEDEPARAKRTG